MPTILPIADIIELGDISNYLALNYESKSGLYRPTVIKPTPPIIIAMVTDALRWGYNDGGGQNTDQSLRLVANYLYWLCGKFQLEAQRIMNGPGGGSVIPTPSGGGVPNPLDFYVSVSSTIATGETTVNFPQFIGYQVNFSRNETMQHTTPTTDGSTYYSWNAVTGDFTISQAAQEGERFRIMPDAGGTGSITPTSAFPFIVTSADFEADGVTLLDSRIVGTIFLISNNVPNPVLLAPTDFTYISGGIEIILPGFDANTFDYSIIVNQLV